MDVDHVVDLVSQKLGAEADADKAGQMAAYMKTTMPMYGVQSQRRKQVLRDVVAQVPAPNRTEYRQLVGALWELPHREEKYLAIAMARHYKDHVVVSMLPLYRSMLEAGAWWDFVDEIAINLVGKLWADDPEAIGTHMDDWIEDDDLWIRRSAIIGQIKHKSETDTARLFRYCRLRAHETDFFIRKAIGWALREYAKTDPEAVRTFVAENADRLSGLSKREATRNL